MTQKSYSIADELLQACKNNNTVQALNCFIPQAKVESYTTLADENGKTAFMWAIINKNETLVHAFLEAGAPLHQKDKNGWGLAFYAAASQCPRIIHLLAQNGVSFFDKKGNTNAYTIACQTGHKASIATIYQILHDDIITQQTLSYMHTTINHQRLKNLHITMHHRCR